jgi:hypothetical protein
LAIKLRIRHLDADRYYWKQTNPPFVEKNDPVDRIRLIERDIAGIDRWILSGSLCSWGDPLLPRFTLAVFLRSSPEVRMARLAARERERYGERIREGGDMCAHHRAFMSWAESYDTASAPIRSLDLHEKWMRRLQCPIVQLDSDLPIDTLVQEVVKHVVAEQGDEPDDGHLHIRCG